MLEAAKARIVTVDALRTGAIAMKAMQKELLLRCGSSQLVFNFDIFLPNYSLVYW